jgi:hypothetical protein
MFYSWDGQYALNALSDTYNSEVSKEKEPGDIKAEGKVVSDMLFFKHGQLLPDSWGRAKVIGVPCGDVDMQQFYSVGCDTSLNDLRGFVVNTGFFIQCVESCKSSEAIVIGNHDGFASESSLCKAAEQQGALTKTPSGLVMSVINVTGFKANYDSSSKNGISSTDKKYSVPVTFFSASPFTPTCPNAI